MRKFIRSFARKTIGDQSGQILPLTAVVLVALMGLGGLGMDFGRAYIAQARLQTYANAAALAAAGVVYNTSTTNNATTYANDYSASTGDENAISYLGTITTTVATKCLNILLPGDTGCTDTSPANAVVVTEKASISTTFMAVLGKKTINIAAVATASMQGSSQPWNIAIIIDSTGSMATVDSNCNNLTEFQCALSGVQALLGSVNPCPSGATSCGLQSNGTTAGTTANIAVSLFTFPNVLINYNGTAVNSLAAETNCGGSPYTWTNYSSQPVPRRTPCPSPEQPCPGRRTPPICSIRRRPRARIQATRGKRPTRSHPFSAISTRLPLHRIELQFRPCTGSRIWKHQRMPHLYLRHLGHRLRQRFRQYLLCQLNL